MSLVFIILMVLWIYCCTGKILGMRFFSHVYQQIGWGELCGSRELVHNVADELDEWLMPNGSVSAVLANHGSSKSSHCFCVSIQPSICIIGISCIANWVLCVMLVLKGHVVMLLLVRRKGESASLYALESTTACTFVSIQSQELIHCAKEHFHTLILRQFLGVPYKVSIAVCFHLDPAGGYCCHDSR